MEWIKLFQFGNATKIEHELYLVLTVEGGMYNGHWKNPDCHKKFGFFLFEDFVI